jgi:GalNAc-alpha-(1->4)-GalNAc-alpha-(1->3)-diNAcBac-PP-undecaprenol alpha-1,4-N-acetyl-D-galactosaminyltransferase
VEKKKLVLVIPSLQTGGMERVLAVLASYFADKPYLEVHIVLYGMHRDIFYSLPFNVMVHKPEFRFMNTLGLRLISSVRTLVYLRKTIRGLKPDSVLSLGEYWNSFVLLALYRLPIRVFVSDRCQPNKHLGFFQERLRKWLYPGAAGIVVQTGIADEYYRRHIRHPNIRVIGNPLREIENPRNIPKENIVLTVGRLIKTKHHDQLISIFMRINKPGWKLVIVGDEVKKHSNLQQIRRRIHELQAEDSIVLVGRRLNVEDYYNQSRIFAFTSSSEGFPNVIGEAQAAGLPVVAFDCMSGPAEMIQDGASGFLVPLFDYQRFQERLAELMDDAELRQRMGAAARLSVKKFAVEKAGAAFESFIFPELHPPK